MLADNPQEGSGCYLSPVFSNFRNVQVSVHLLAERKHGTNFKQVIY